MAKPVFINNPDGASFIERNYGNVVLPEIGGNATLNKGQYSVFVGGTERFFDLSDFVVSIEYKFDFDTPYAAFGIVFSHPTITSRFLVPGNWVVVYGPYWNNSDVILQGEDSIGAQFGIADGKSLYEEIDRGQIASVEKEIGDNGKISIAVKDPAWILAKSKLPVRLPFGTFTERLRFLSEQVNIPLYEPLIETEHQLKSTRGGRETIWNDIVFDLHETNRVEGKRYVLRHRKGSFFIQEVTDQEYMWAFEVGSNLISLKINQSIEDYYNKIYILTNSVSDLDALLGGSNGDATSLELPYVGFAVNEDEFDRFGQHVLVVSEDLTSLSPTAQAQADNLLEKNSKIKEIASLVSYSLNGLRWGDQILVHEPVSNVSGVFWVRGGVNKIIAGQAIMNLDIEFDYLASEAVREEQSSDVSVIFDTLGLDSGAGVDFKSLP